MSENQEVKPEIQNTQTKVESQPEQKIEDVKQVIQSEESPEIKTESNKPNWAKFREDRERDRKARVEAEERAERQRLEAEALRAAMEALVNKNVQPQHQDVYHQESDEDRIAKMVADALAKERIKISEEQKRREIEELPNRLRQNHRDFDQVCSAENLDYMDYHHPKISQAFSAMPNTQEKWEAVYDTMKKLVPYGNKKTDEARIERNMQKPQAATPNMTDTSPKGSSWMLSEERKKANWERMQKERKSFLM